MSGLYLQKVVAFIWLYVCDASKYNFKITLKALCTVHMRRDALHKKQSLNCTPVYDEMCIIVYTLLNIQTTYCAY